MAYARNFYKKDNLSGGSFEANITFAQSLTEAARAVPKTLLVASIPASEIEIGGDGGEMALEQLKYSHAFASRFQPASATSAWRSIAGRHSGQSPNVNRDNQLVKGQ